MSKLTYAGEKFPDLYLGQPFRANIRRVGRNPAEKEVRTYVRMDSDGTDRVVTFGVERPDGNVPGEGFPVAPVSVSYDLLGAYRCALLLDTLPVIDDDRMVALYEDVMDGAGESRTRLGVELDLIRSAVPPRFADALTVLYDMGLDAMTPQAYALFDSGQARMTDELQACGFETKDNYVKRREKERDLLAPFAAVRAALLDFRGLRNDDEGQAQEDVELVLLEMVRRGLVDPPLMFGLTVLTRALLDQERSNRPFGGLIGGLFGTSLLDFFFHEPLGAEFARREQTLTDVARQAMELRVPTDNRTVAQLRKDLANLQRRWPRMLPKDV